MDAQYLNAGVLFKIAVTAYERTKAASSERTGDQNDALVAILFAAATLEAFVMELATIAEADGTLFANPRLRSLSSLLDETEASRGSPRLKFLLAKAVLTGDSYDRGAAPYQDFETLFMLRDALIHLKPEGVKERERILERLRGLGIYTEVIPNQTSSWLGHVGTRAAARWACNVVVDMVRSVAEDLAVDRGRAPLTTFFLTGGFNRVE